MTNQNNRTISLIGQERFSKLENSNILIIGVGGVGSFTAEALVRAGIKKITIIDSDTVAETNLNRQLIALHSTIGKSKVEVAKQRYLDINKNAEITTKTLFITPENAAYLDFCDYDFIVDAIDNVPAKIALIEQAYKKNTPIISCMGTGNKLHPEKFEIEKISKTTVCPLAKVMRKELGKRGIKDVPVLYSKESPVDTNLVEENKRVPASISTVPSVAGLLIANHVILNLIGLN